MSETNMPPHPGLEALTNIDDLKHLCPAFSKGCPYAALKEADTVSVSRGDLSRCPAFKEGCPFSTKSREEIVKLMSEIPKDHPTLNMSELPSCEEGVELVKMLNSFLDKTQMEFLFNVKSEAEKEAEELKIVKEETEPEYLEDPQLASAMREGTKVVHRAAETSVFTKRFLKGEINADEYGRYINSLYFVYRHMEQLLVQYKNHPVVSLIHFPYELNREEALLQDLEFFYGPEKTSELIQDEAMTPAVQKYVNAMKAACEKSPSLLIAHSYSRYLGDLSGGQILSGRLKKCVFKLDKDSGAWDTTEGLKFYSFHNLGNQTEFKNSYREKLNAAKVDKETRDLIVKEAVASFEYNIALFDEIQELSEAGKLAHSLFQAKEEEVIVVQVEEKVTVTTIEVNNEDDGRKTKKNNRGGNCAYKWIGTVTFGVAVVAVGAAMYQRYYQNK